MAGQPRFSINYTTSDGATFSADYLSFDDVPTSPDFWENVVKLQISFTKAVPETPLFFRELKVENGVINYIGKKKIPTNEGWLESLLLYSAEEIERVESKYSLLRKYNDRESLKVYFDRRNRRLFELFGSKIDTKSDSWKPAVAALAAAGMLGLLKSKQNKAQEKVVEQVQEVEV